MQRYGKTSGGFGLVDPLADISRRFSPYAYGNNNPLKFIDPTGMTSEEAKDFEYSDGYSNLSARNSRGSLGFSGVYKTTGQDGCPPNCGGYGGGNPSTPYTPGSHLKSAAQQNATISPSKTDNFTEVEKAAQLGVNIAWAVEGGLGLIRGAASFLKNGVKIAKSWFKASETVESGMTSVGRWMSKTEYELMAKTGQMVEVTGGKLL